MNINYQIKIINTDVERGILCTFEVEVVQNAVAVVGGK